MTPREKAVAALQSRGPYESRDPDCVIEAIERAGLRVVGTCEGCVAFELTRERSDFGCCDQFECAMSRAGGCTRWEAKG